MPPAQKLAQLLAAPGRTDSRGPGRFPERPEVDNVLGRNEENGSPPDAPASGSPHTEQPLPQDTFSSGKSGLGFASPSAG